MLILAVVTVSSALNAGIFTRSKTAASKTQEERDKEILAAAATAAVDDYGNFTYEALDNNLPEGFTGSNGTYIKNGITYNINESGILTAQEVNVSKRNSITPKPSGTTYNVGDEVTFGGEKFFVFSDNGTEIKLLAKFCLSKTKNEQLTEDATTSDYGRSFASTNYWESDIELSGCWESTFELQGEYLKSNPLSSSETEANNAIKKAQAYGESKGVIGRLMTYEEVVEYVDSSSVLNGILSGESYLDSNDYLCYWLGTVPIYSCFGSDKVLCYYGYAGDDYIGSYNTNVRTATYSYSDSIGVRPILIIK